MVEGEQQESKQQRHTAAQHDQEAIVICPSNPWVSIDPILAVGRSYFQSDLPIKKGVAISPIIGGQTVKGPAAKMYRELGIEPSVLAVAKHFHDILSGFVLDKMDAEFEITCKDWACKRL